MKFYNWLKNGNPGNQRNRETGLLHIKYRISQGGPWVNAYDELSTTTRDFVTKFNQFLSAIICMQLENSTLPDGIVLINISDTEQELVEFLEDAKEKILKEGENFKETALASLISMQSELNAIIEMLQSDKEAK